MVVGRREIMRKEGDTKADYIYECEGEYQAINMDCGRNCYDCRSFGHIVGHCRN